MTISNVQKAKIALLGAISAVEAVEVLEDCQHAKEAMMSLWWQLNKPVAIEIKPRKGRKPKAKQGWWTDGQGNEASGDAGQGSSDLGPDQSHR